MIIIQEFKIRFKHNFCFSVEVKNLLALPYALRAPPWIAALNEYTRVDSARPAFHGMLSPSARMLQTQLLLMRGEPLRQDLLLHGRLQESDTSISVAELT